MSNIESKFYFQERKQKMISTKLGYRISIFELKNQNKHTVKLI